MSALSEAFSALNCGIKDGIELTLNGGARFYSYNFLTRTMACSSGQGIAVIPFSELDREALEAFHAEYIRKGGKLPLPPSTHTVFKHKLGKPGQG